MKFIQLYLVAACALSLTLNACTTPPQQSQQTEASDVPEWITLFDGTSLEGWRGFNQDTLPANWIIEDGTLKALGTGGDIGGDIVYGAQEFEHFDLKLEWKISEGGNSGIFYHIHEGENYRAPYENAPEYQVLDDIGFPQPLEDWQKVGADYAMYPADTTTKQVKPAGEWNTARIRYTVDKVTYWLNDAIVVEFEPGSEDWTQRRNSGKWDQYPDYAKYPKGLIGFQDHGDEVWYRNIQIMPL
ncbi:DUF1080 domain-containing protein [Pontibacter sp. G13]|uniref:3-keto-disaccharide hydrolase n=1 Tax=Pontibacter sp. G13 TaxID=3074898 RepID=UPI00288BD0C8|nr:DUF1080 domain-containing protein [Pontibacter sp. G13]WNJ19989.1 DUF1080 domain-containing protein [Pontibacter sp. G13]